MLRLERGKHWPTCCQGSSTWTVNFCECRSCWGCFGSEGHRRSLVRLHRPKCERNGPGMLVLTPTRELALQIQAECKKYSYLDYTRFSPAALRVRSLSAAVVIVCVCASSQCLYLRRRGPERPDHPGSERRGRCDRNPGPPQ